LPISDPLSLSLSLSLTLSILRLALVSLVRPIPRLAAPSFSPFHFSSCFSVFLFKGEKEREREREGARGKEKMKREPVHRVGIETGSLLLAARRGGGGGGDAREGTVRKSW